MSWRLRRLSLFAAPAALAAGTLALAAPQVIGIASVVVNSVTISSGGAPAHPAAVRQRVALADQVRTGAASRLQLTLLDRSVFTVGANARLTIDRFVYNPAGGAMTATIAKGAFRFLSGGGHQPGSSIGTPVATIGIRGTILDGVVGSEAIAIARGERALGASPDGDPATATLVVLRGPGSRHEGSAAVGVIDVTAAGRTVTLDQPLLAAYVPRAGAAPIGPFTLSLPGLARLDQLIIPARVVNRPETAEPYPLPPPRPPAPPPYGYPGGGPEGSLGGRNEGPGQRGGFGNIPGGAFPDRPTTLDDRPTSVRTQQTSPTSVPTRTTGTPAPSPSPSPSPSYPPTRGGNPNSVP